MCGRYTKYLSWSEIHRLYRLTAPAETGRNDEPRYNIAPTQDVPFVTAGEDGTTGSVKGAGGWSLSGQRKCPRRLCSMRGLRASMQRPPSATRLQVQALPDPCRWLLRVDDIASRRQERPLAHLPARPRAFLVRRALGLQFQSRHNQLHHHHRACRRTDEAVA